LFKTNFSHRPFPSSPSAPRLARLFSGECEACRAPSGSGKGEAEKFFGAHSVGCWPKGRRRHRDEPRSGDAAIQGRGAQPVLEENSPPSLPYNPLDCRVPLASLGVLAMTARRYRNQQLT
jgi:hypothetical protein